MPAADNGQKWFRAVDDNPDTALLLTVMDETAQWAATRELRAWERSHLALQPGERLLDVGCGLGDAARALSVDLGPEGSVVGIDGSEVMVAHARARAAKPVCPMRFAVGDALSLDEPADAFDAVRSERMLQWTPDPATAVSEMARVVRPGGRVCLIDTDWSTYDIEVGDPNLSQRVQSTYGTERNRKSLVGARLAALAKRAGLETVTETSATQVWSEWDPDKTPRLDGWVPMRDLADDLISASQLDPTERETFVATIHNAARAGRFTMRLTMYALVARAPG